MAVSPVMTNAHAATHSRNAMTRNTAASVQRTAVSPREAPGTDDGTSTGGTGAGSGSSAEDLLNSFMTLLVAQMQNQDPTNPMDNNQLTTQLAQFETAAGIQTMNGTLNQVGTLVASMQQMNSSDWVGRTVLVEGDTAVSTADDGNKDFALSLNSDADEVQVTLTDSAGNAYTATLDDVKAGVHQYSLDDLKDFQPSDPREQADTSFDVSFSASNKDGSTPEIVSLKKAVVDGVAFTQTGALLQLGADGTAQLGEVYLIE